MRSDGADLSTAPGEPRLDRAAVESAATVRVIAGRNVSKADVRVVRVDGRLVAVKDYRRRPFWARNTVGRFLVRRECRAMEAATGIPGIPAFMGRIDAFALATAWVEAEPLASFLGRIVPPEVFDSLEAIVGALHARGVALGDIHHRDVLVGTDGRVFVVDLATAVVAPSRALPWRRALAVRLMEHDRLNLARLRARFSGRTEEEALAALDPSVVRRYNAGRRVKSIWDRLRGKGA
ncbi:MAG TPA: hypothetical protein VMR65_01630 [Candidatus Sulfotelmatobacter sp.]|nr:hypothetical protein [Candidatus Sulfotelmatobacter sp.]